MAEKIAQIYDKLFKKIPTLSSVAVTSLINGLFGTDYPPDSKITYSWTKTESRDLTRRLADTIITTGCSHSYHAETQMMFDNDVMLRVFEYGFGLSNQNRQKTGERLIFYFPEQKIIYRQVIISVADGNGLKQSGPRKGLTPVGASPLPGA